jgi:hypothetical protein
MDTHNANPTGPFGAEAIPGTTPAVDSAAVSERSFVVTFWLLFFLGVFGAHRFYVGKIGTGLAMIAVCLLTFGIASGIWYLVDMFLLISGEFRDADRRRVLQKRP